MYNLKCYFKILFQFNATTKKSKVNESEVQKTIDERKLIIREQNSIINEKSAELDKLEKEKIQLEQSNKKINHKQNDLKENLTQANRQVKPTLN